MSLLVRSRNQTSPQWLTPTSVLVKLIRVKQMLTAAQARLSCVARETQHGPVLGVLLEIAVRVLLLGINVSCKLQLAYAAGTGGARTNGPLPVIRQGPDRESGSSLAGRQPSMM